MIGSVVGSNTTYTLSYTAPSTVNTTSVIASGVSGGADSYEPLDVYQTFVLGDGTKSILDTWLKQISDMQDMVTQIVKMHDEASATIIGNLKL